MTDPILVDPTASLWVSAHAGAGKTRVLIDRVTRLLIAGTAPEQILCLTFTKAAAAEMATRLSGKLGTLALADDETLRKLLAELHVAPDAVPLNVTRRLFARALETPGGLKIQTIHAFCERLLGRFPIEAGIAPGFEVLDDRTAAELLGLAQAQIIAATREYKTRDALATLSPLGETAMLQSVVRQLIDAKRNLAAQGLPVDLEACAANVSDALGLAQGETPEALRQNFLDGVPRAALREAVQVLARGNKTDQKYATLLTEIRFESYREIFLTAKDAPRQNICSAAISQAHPDIEALLRAEQTRVLVHVERSKLALAGARAEAALHLGMRIIARYEALKQQRGVLDYDDLIGKTVALFERSAAAWVLFKLDNGIDHILVDEAQDTNPLQWRAG
jgi:ATP-dependent helicase/nuclease subunit A